MKKLDGDDRRLIRGGKFLRAAGLDELPQLVNVLRGEMSLVGPRPCTPSEVEKYTRSSMKRFNGLPGLTGSWQVNGKNTTNFRRMVALDIQYLRTASIGRDFAVMLRTVPVLLGQLKEAGKNNQVVARERATAPAPPVLMRKARPPARRLRLLVAIPATPAPSPRTRVRPTPVLVREPQPPTGRLQPRIPRAGQTIGAKAQSLMRKTQRLTLSLTQRLTEVPDDHTGPVRFGGADG